MCWAPFAEVSDGFSAASGRLVISTRMVSRKLQILTGFSCGRIVWMLNSEPGIASVLDKDASVSGGMERDDPGCRLICTLIRFVHGTSEPLV